MTTESTGPGKWKTLSIGYEEALARLPDALKAEGFGIITEIDMTRTLEAKLGVQFRRYRIIGACNPTFAHAALQKDLRIGALLPCNVVLYEGDDGKAVLGAVDPMQTVGASAGTDALRSLAAEVGTRLDRVLAGFPS